MKTSLKGLALIEQFEGCELASYRDSAGVWTIGIGHTSDVKLGDVCTREQAQAWLAQDVVEAEDAVNRLVRVILTQDQFDALVSFTFNLGPGYLMQSTLLELVNTGDMSAAAMQFSRWDMAGGKPSAGLLRRRVAEAALFSGNATGVQA